MKRLSSQEIVKTLIKWFSIIVAMMAFVLVSAIMSRWMQEKIWMVFMLDGMYFFFLWLLIDVVASSLHHRVSLTKSTTTKIIVYTFIIAILIFIIAAATLGLFDILVVRLNLILLPIVSLVIVYRSFKRRGTFD